MPERLRFTMDLLEILDEALSNQQRAKRALNSLCDFWEAHGVFYGNFSQMKQEAIEKLDQLPKRSSGVKVMRNAVLELKIDKSRQFLKARQPYDLLLGDINDCVEMASHSDKFRLAVLTDRQAGTFVTNVNSDDYCRHCEDVVEVISWEFIEEACRVKEAMEEVEKARIAAEVNRLLSVKIEEVASEWIRLVPVGASAQSRWEMFFREYAREASRITLVDQYVGKDKDSIQDAEDIDNFLTFLNDDFSHSENPNRSITIYTTCPKNRKEDYRGILSDIVRDKVNLKDNVTVYIFNPFYDSSAEKRFPRERWVGFDDTRLMCHGIDFLSYARQGEAVILLPGGVAQNLREIERKLRDKELGDYVDKIPPDKSEIIPVEFDG